MENLTETEWYHNNFSFINQEVKRIRFILEKYLNPDTNISIPDANYLKTSRLDILCSKLNISSFERDLLLFLVGMEIDPYFVNLCTQYNSQQNYATFSLALSALPNPRWSIFSLTNPLQYWQLIEFTPNITQTQTPIKIDLRILCFLLGETTFDEKLIGLIEPFPQRITNIPLSQSQIDLATQITLNWSNINGEYPLLQLCGFETTVKYRIAYEISQRLNYNIFLMNASVLPQDSKDISYLKRRLERESFLSNTILLLECDEFSVSQPRQKIYTNIFLENILTPIIISSEEKLECKHRSIINWDISNINYTEQKEIWEINLGSLSNELNGEISRITSQFNLSPALIQTACDQVKTYQLNQPEKEVNPHIIQQQLWDFCRTQARPKLADLALRIDSYADWDDLILPEKHKNVLKDMEAHLRHKAKIYEEWGFGGREKRGLGIAALFAGQSGTGKTMAAGVIAKKLNLDLYRIDLSSIVSKYIGETEKNLRKIFDAAETGGAILLFDEADALFGKRTEVKDSHDRHANVEVSYLLQRMESYQGLAILTTNLKSSLDQAFLRRIRFVINFPFPDEDSRSEIWKRSFPPQTPTQELDFWRLGSLNVAGGNIKNIALNAAVYAAEDNEPVMMKHILRATQAEYIKLERTLSNQEIRGWV